MLKENEHNQSGFETQSSCSGFETTSNDSGSAFEVTGGSGFETDDSGFTDSKASTLSLKSALEIDPNAWQIVNNGKQIWFFNEKKLANQGAMGVVSRAQMRDGHTRRDVLIKRLFKSNEPGYENKAKIFQNESIMSCEYALGCGNHVVRGLFKGENEKEQVLILDFIEGVSLDKKISIGCYKKNIAACKNIIEGILDGLANLHEAGIIHRDLKPENVMVKDGDVPVIIDLGLACKTGIEDLSLKTVGTPKYAAPEQNNASKRNKICFASDIYSVGLMFCEILTGSLSLNDAYGLDDSYDKYKHFIDKCCKMDPFDRYANGKLALEAFKKCGERDKEADLKMLKRKIAESYGDDGILDEEEKKEILALGKSLELADDTITRALRDGDKDISYFKKNTIPELIENDKENELYKEAELLLLSKDVAKQWIDDYKKEIKRRAEEKEAADQRQREMVIRQQKKAKTLKRVVCALLIALIASVVAIVLQDKNALPGDSNEKNRMLLTAAGAGDINLVSRLLEAGAYIDTQDSVGVTPLEAAIRLGHQELIDTLLAHKPNVNVADNNGKTAIYYAIQNNNNAAFGALLEASDLAHHDKQGKTPLFFAASKGNATNFEGLLKKTSFKDLETSYDALNAAVTNGEMGQVLAKAKNVIPNILEAIRKDDISSFKVNMSYREGADTCWRDEDGSSMLHVAASNGSVKAISSLVADYKMSMDAVDNQGRTPLHNAAYRNDQDLMKTIIDLGGQVDVKDNYGKKPTNYATSNAVKTFLYQYENRNKLVFEAVKRRNLTQLAGYIDLGASPNLKDEQGVSIVHYAAMSPDTAILHYLIEKGASVENVDENGCTPIFYAVAKKSQNALISLLKHGASVTKQDNNGTSLLHMTIAQGDTLMSTVLIKVGLNVNVADKNGQTPLFVAVEKNSMMLSKYLLSKGTNVNHLNNRGQSALTAYDNSTAKNLYEHIYCDYLFMKAIENNNLKEASRFLKIGADINTYDSDNKATVAHLAMKHKEPDTWNFLTKNKINWNLFDSNGDVPLTVALNLGNIDGFVYLTKLASVNKNAVVKGMPILHWSILNNLAFTEAMVNRGASLTQKNNLGYDAVAFAVANNRADVLTMLLNRGANVNWTDEKKNSLLHLAAQKGASANIINILISKGLNVYEENEDGDEPIDVAEDHGHKNTAKAIDENRSTIRVFFGFVWDIICWIFSAIWWVIKMIGWAIYYIFYFIWWIISSIISLF